MRFPIIIFFVGVSISILEPAASFSSTRRSATTSRSPGRSRRDAVAPIFRLSDNARSQLLSRVERLANGASINASSYHPDLDRQTQEIYRHTLASGMTPSIRHILSLKPRSPRAKVLMSQMSDGTPMDQHFALQHITLELSSADFHVPLRQRFGTNRIFSRALEDTTNIVKAVANESWDAAAIRIALTLNEGN